MNHHRTAATRRTQAMHRATRATRRAAITTWMDAAFCICVPLIAVVFVAVNVWPVVASLLP